MILWLRARRAPWCLVISWTLALLAGLASARLPSLFLLYDNSTGAPARLVLPALAATALLTTLVSPTPRADDTSTQPRVVAVVLFSAAALSTCAIAEIPPLALGDDLASGLFTRNLLGFLGVGLLARVVLPSALAPLTPLAWMIPTLTLGRPDGDLLSWPLIMTLNDPRGLIPAAVLLIAGTAAHILLPQRPGVL